MAVCSHAIGVSGCRSLQCLASSHAQETNAEKARQNWSIGLTLDFTSPSKLVEHLHFRTVATERHCEYAWHLLLLCFGTAIRLIAAEQARQAPLIEGRAVCTDHQSFRKGKAERQDTDSLLAVKCRADCVTLLRATSDCDFLVGVSQRKSAICGESLCLRRVALAVRHQQAGQRKPLLEASRTWVCCCCSRAPQHG
jgi:hypothetical protein